MSSIFGIVGSLANDGRAVQDFSAMSAALDQAGPDGHSEHVDHSSDLMFGFRWLRTAADEAGPEIVTSEDGSLVMVCDGHVFNAADLRPVLRDRGHVVRSAHSSELLLHLYEEDGPAGWRRADAQFALAIWDRSRRQLVLARDFLGVRSLYYWAGPSGIVFSSRIRALLRHAQVPRGLDGTALSDFLTFTSVPGPRTLFDGIGKVPPGTAVFLSRERGTRSERYWDILDSPIPETPDERFYVDRVRSLHAGSVQRRIVPGAIGSLLSGGNDSSANASLMARGGSAPLHTFTVGLAELEGDAKYNDLEYARRVARYISSDHHEYLLSTDEFLKTIPPTIDAMDDVVSEPSSVFLYHALKMAKERGLRVIVTGEANDELCCGHGGMINIRDGYYKRWLPYMRRPAFVRKMAASVVPAFAPKLADILQRAAAGQQYFWSYEMAWRDTDKSALLNKERCAGAQDAARIVDACRAHFDQSGHRDRDYLFYVIYAMMQDFYFGNLMLGKLELLASSLGIEPRCPYTEPAYAHFVYNVPAPLKARDGLVKYFFKKAIEGVLPDEIIYRPKQGFRTPVVELFKGALGTWAEPILLETGLTREGVLKQSHLRSLLQKHRAGEGDYANRLWTAMTVNLWYDRWIRA